LVAILQLQKQAAVGLRAAVVAWMKYLMLQANVFSTARPARVNVRSIYCDGWIWDLADSKRESV
jgi:hypothetical protein